MMRIVPFVPDTTEDDLHCLQCAWMMIAKYFDPDFEIPMDEWSKLTGFEESKGSWASAGLLWFKLQGYDVKHVSLFDYEKFAQDPAQYLIDLTGPEVADWQIKHSNLPLEAERAKQLLAAGIAEKREPQMDDIKRYLDDDYLVHALVNMAKLNDKPGYIGHAVTIFDYDDQGLTFHDPGKPAFPDRHETYDKFTAAWADPNAESKEISVIKKV